MYLRQDMQPATLGYHCAALGNPTVGLALYEVREAEFALEFKRHLVETSTVDGVESRLGISDRVVELARGKTSGGHRIQLRQSRVLTATRRFYEFLGPRAGF